MRTRREVSKKSTFPSSFDRFQRGFVNVHTYIYIYIYMTSKTKSGH